MPVSNSNIKLRLSGEVQRDVMEETQQQLAFKKILESWINEKIPIEQRGGVSDANIAASSGCITLDGFGPYGEGDHTIYEKASKKSYFQRIDMVSKILKHFQTL